jgi:hypothetical protein
MGYSEALSTHIGYPEYSHGVLGGLLPAGDMRLPSRAIANEWPEPTIDDSIDASDALSSSSARARWSSRALTSTCAPRHGWREGV